MSAPGAAPGAISEGGSAQSDHSHGAPAKSTHGGVSWGESQHTNMPNPSAHRPVRSLHDGAAIHP